MKKLFTRALALLMTVAAATGVMQAQSPDQVPALPADPALRTGQLENGLTYYIRHNETPKGQADFYIAQKVGSILEEDHQRGLAHFLEHMCFNGTENFPEKGIINWLESVGVKFGRNLNAYTSIDETVYNISDVPVARTSVQDSCLLILHDWACALTLDPKEIDAERAVIHEEWRQSNVGAMRALEGLLPVMYPDNRYGYRLPIGTMEVVDNFPPQALIDYYHKWYRPDQQGIIVVGDIDVDYIEGKIKEMFSGINMPENPAERVYFPVEETPGTIYAIGTDKEIQSPTVDMMFKTDALYLPREYRNSQMYFPVAYISSMIESMLNSRLSDLANKPETEFARARVDVGDYFLSKTQGSLNLDVYAKDTDVVPAFTQAYRELLRAVRGGFTEGEYERAKAEYISRYDKLYAQRNDVTNDAYSKEYVRLFVDNIPAPGIEFEKNMVDQLVQVITVEQINQVLGQLVSDDNRVLLALLPDSPNFPVPTQEQFDDAIEAVDAETLEPYKDEMRDDPLIPNLPAPGKVVATAHNDLWDATEYTLSNGVKVIVKPTDFKADQIVFEAIAKDRALSSIDPALAASAKYAPYAMSAQGLFDYSNSDLKKYLQGKQVDVDFGFDAYTRQLSGHTITKDLPLEMEMIYAFFNGFNLKEDEFAAKQAAFAGILANQESNPQYIFQKDFLGVLFSTPMTQPISSEDIKAADRQTIIDIIKGMTANAADYLFVFTGSIDLDTFVPLMEQYIATLPADAATASSTITHNPAFEISDGNGIVPFTTKMETPQTWVFLALTGTTEYTPKNKLLASITGQILSKRLLDKVREEMGAVYSIGASGSLSRTSGVNTVIQSGFPMKPELKDEVITVIKGIFNDVATEVSPEELKPAVEYLQKEAVAALRENSDWAGAITATSVNGVPTFLTVQEDLQTITPADVQTFMKQLLDQNRFRFVVLDPEN